MFGAAMAMASPEYRPGRPLFRAWMASAILPPVTSVAVIGAGAVGCYYGALLARAGVDVRFLMRRDLDAVRQHGLDVRSPDGDFRLHEVQVHEDPAEIGVCD